MAGTCRRDGCEAEFTNTKRVACVDEKYSGRDAVGRYVGVCPNNHISQWDELEG